MRRKLSLIATVLALTSACSGSLTGNGQPSGSGQNNIGLGNAVFNADDRDQAPDLSGTTLDGTQLDVSQWVGHVVVVNFWASWCGPCRAEADNLDTAFTKTKAMGVQFVGVDFRDDKTSAKAFQRIRAVPYPSLYDQDGTLLLKFRGQAPQEPPTTLILDKKGRVAARFTGGVTVDELLGPLTSLTAETA